MSEINNNTNNISEVNTIKLSYYQRNKDKLLEYQRKYNKENQKECIERNKKYYDKEYYRLYYHSKISPKRNIDNTQT